MKKEPSTRLQMQQFNEIYSRHMINNGYRKYRNDSFIKELSGDFFIQIFDGLGREGDVLFIDPVVHLSSHQFVNRMETIHKDSCNVYSLFYFFLQHFVEKDDYLESWDEGSFIHDLGDISHAIELMDASLNDYAMPRIMEYCSFKKIKALYEKELAGENFGSLVVVDVDDNLAVIEEILNQQ